MYALSKDLDLVFINIFEMKMHLADSETKNKQMKSNKSEMD